MGDNRLATARTIGRIVGRVMRLGRAVILSRIYRRIGGLTGHAMAAQGYCLRIRYGLTTAPNGIEIPVVSVEISEPSERL